MVEVKNKRPRRVGHRTREGMKGDAIDAADTTNMDTIAKNYAYRTLNAHGNAVGLSDGLMGNSEVGHLNIGAGRIVWQDIVRIDVAIAKRQFHQNKNILESMNHAKEGNGRLHLLGLVSDGGVHSHIHHLKALLETAKESGVPHTYIHFFAKGYAEDLLSFLESESYGELATVVGRYYAMDRDKRWERVKVAVDALVEGKGEETTDVLKTIQERYDNKETDEFLKPIIVNGAEGRIKDGDTLFFFNYRSDRMRELTAVIGLPDKPIEVNVPKDLHITTMSRYNAEYPFAIAFPPQAMTNASHQAHIAETEKYAHVTFFFNGGVEKQFPSEERYMIASPKVATYDLQPEMSAQGVADKVAEVVKSQKHEFVMCNFAPPDMVGHTGVLDAAIKAITATDKAVGTIYDACEEAGYVLLITADHGNAEQMLNPETGEPHTAHTTNKVPFIMTGKELEFVEDVDGASTAEEAGALADVAPTVLAVMGLPQPEEMTGRSLLKKN
ncbi:cofactor-independent phosphoglycerate mutase [Melanogaster broomeanus]|nr:cofactor-independent phosphoglycerate mutase [Melanogaster broomeanus]